MAIFQFTRGCCLVGILLLVGCQSRVVPVLPAVFSVDATPKMLAEPAMMDWASQRITSPRIVERRIEYRRQVQAFAPPAGWSSGSGGTAHPGIRLDTLPTVGASLANDWVPNGAACTYFTSGSPASVRNKIFFLTRNGKLLRVAQDKSAAAACDLNSAADTTGAPGGQTFSRTYVTLSPAGGRSYVLSDQGNFFVVNNDTMKGVWVASVGGANNTLAPVIDPNRSSHSDGQDIVYVPSRTGVITRYTVKRGTTTAPAPVATQTGSFNLGGTLEATPIVLDGKIFAGDASGNFYRYDADTSLLISSAPCGYPIKATPTLNLDASGNVTDAFVNVGTTCLWIQYAADGSVLDRTFSRPLFIDEKDSKKSGALAQWSYNAAATKYWIPAIEGVTLNTENPAVNLPTIAPASYKTNSYLGYAETGTRGTAAAPAGGPVVSYIRWDTSVSRLPSAAIVSGVKVWLRARPEITGYKLKPPAVRKADPTIGSKLWTMTPAGGFTEITQANFPSFNTGTLALEFDVPINNKDRINYGNGTWYGWNFAAAATAYTGANFGVAVADESNDDVYWEGGPAVVNNNSNSPNKTAVNGPKYYYTAGLADYLGSTTSNLITKPADGTTPLAGAAVGGYESPLLELLAAGKQQPSVSLETPPIVDVTNGRRKVYVINSNTLFSIDFTDKAAWGDTAGADTTAFNVLYNGDKDQAGRYPTFPASGGSANTICVEHRTAPLLDFDGNNLYLLDRYPTAGGTSPTSYSYALNRIRLPIVNTPTTRKAYTAGANGDAVVLRPNNADSVASRDAAAYMVMDFFTYNTSGSRVYLALPTTAAAAGYVYQLSP